ncbi:hypothetical protein HY024_01555 [Candidatus Curtissbacteria bacterium]|nr:hypothetical protein [Candidatus Curtissbacteria bacterium]
MVTKILINDRIIAEVPDEAGLHKTPVGILDLGFEATRKLVNGTWQSRYVVSLGSQEILPLKTKGKKGPRRVEVKDGKGSQLNPEGILKVETGFDFSTLGKER